MHYASFLTDNPFKVKETIIIPSHVSVRESRSYAKSGLIQNDDVLNVEIQSIEHARVIERRNEAYTVIPPIIRFFGEEGELLEIFVTDDFCVLNNRHVCYKKIPSPNGFTNQGHNANSFPKSMNP